MVSVLVTGASRGIGLGLVKELLKSNDVNLVIATARQPEKATELKAISDKRLKIIQLTVDDDESIKKAVAKTAEIVGNDGLDILVNNSGVFKALDPKHPVRADMIEQLNVDVVSVAMLNAAMLPVLRKAVARKGFAQIVSISSLLGSSTLCYGNSHDFNNCAYNMGKAALNRYTCYVSKEWADEKIRLTCLCPGWVKTDMGTQAAVFTVEDSTKMLAKNILALDAEHNGQFLNYDMKKFEF